RDYSSDTKGRLDAGFARGTAARHDHCTAMKPDLCSKRAKQGMAPIGGRRCSHPGCMTRPSFGTAGSTKREFCAQHAKQGMIDRHHKRCGHPGCVTLPSYGKNGSTKREYCSQHAKQGMVDLVHKRC
ncbi:unnamed protein product, partial [Ectocarpus sp. 8 AP-2014]